MTFLPRTLAAVILACGAVAPAVQSQDVSIKNEEPVVFQDVLTKQPLKFNLKPEQEITEAVRKFHSTAKNPYVGDSAAISDGKEIFNSICSSCHGEQGKGGMGPSLVDDTWTHEGLETDKGMFEIIYGGGVGAMQAFGRRYDQDQILRVMAYIRQLRGN